MLAPGWGAITRQIACRRTAISTIKAIRLRKGSRTTTPPPANEIPPQNLSIPRLWHYPDFPKILHVNSAIAALVLPVS